MKYVVALLLSLLALTTHAAQQTETINNANTAQPLSAKDVYAKVEKSIFTIYVDDKEEKKPVLSGGSVAITDTLLATNCHVIEDTDHFYIESAKGKLIEGKLVSADTKQDICLISSPGMKFTPVDIRLSRDVDIGEDVYAIGNPEALEKSISRGIISNKHEGENFLLQTDAALSPGSSGGGLFDNHGKLIGLTTAKGDAGIGFVAPTEVIVALQLNPKTSAKIQTESSEQVINEIGVYGENKVGLYLNGDMCFITLKGSNSDNKTTSAAIWVPSDPDVILIFPTAGDVTTAMNIAVNMDSTKIYPSKDKLMINKATYELVSMNQTTADQGLAAVLEKDPMVTFLDNEDMTLKIADKRSPNGYRDIHFGLKGFKEALSEYHTRCH